MALLSLLVACGSAEDDPPSSTSSGVGGAATSSSSSSGGTGGSGGSVGVGGGGGSTSVAPPRVLLFSRTSGFRHGSIPDAIAALEVEGMMRGWTVAASEDPETFTAMGLAAYDVVVFLLTTGDVLDGDQQAALEGFVEAGGGWAGVHSASDTEYDWTWYGGLVAAYFDGHPAPQNADVVVEDPSHPSTSHLPATWNRFDEWYSFDRNPRTDVDVLLSLDESTYNPGNLAMGDHPIAWARQYEGGRAFYTAGGHTSASYEDTDFLTHLAEGIEWASGR